METRYYPAKSGKWRFEISGTEDDAKIHTFGSAPRHVVKDCERLNGCGYKYSAALVVIGMAALYGFMWLYSLAAYIDSL